MAKRVSKDLAEAAREGSANYKITQSAEDPFLCHATINGPADSPYSGGIFRLNILFPSDYAMKPPKVNFTTKVYHPNVNSNGSICLEMLRDSWSPACTISKVLTAIYDLLREPNPDDPLAPEIAIQFKTNKPLFEKTAREHTQQYAK